MKKTEQYTTIDGHVIDDGEFNLRAVQWTMAVKSAFRVNLLCDLSGKQSGSLLKSVKSSILKSGGMINRIGFDFHRYGVFMAYGVGRGYVHTSGGVIRGMRSDAHRKSKGSKDKGVFKAYASNGINRKPIDWFDSELPENIEILADLITNFYGDKFLINEDAITRLSIVK